MQHMTMFSFFFLNGLVDLLYHFRVPAMPKQLDYLSAVLAFAMEGVLFLWHLDGRSPLDVQVKYTLLHFFIFEHKQISLFPKCHTFLLYVIAMCIITGLGEMAWPRDVRPALGRSAFIILQGNKNDYYVRVHFTIRSKNHLLKALGSGKSATSSIPSGAVPGTPRVTRT